MKHHVFAFLLALAVWVVGNVVVDAYFRPVAAQTGNVAMGCVPRTDVYINNACGSYPACSGFCSRFEYDTARCVLFAGFYCMENDAPVPYRHYRANCIPSWGFGCACNSMWTQVGSGTMLYPKCP